MSIVQRVLSWSVSIERGQNCTTRVTIQLKVRYAISLISRLLLVPRLPVAKKESSRSSGERPRSMSSHRIWRSRRSGWPLSSRLPWWGRTFKVSLILFFHFSRGSEPPGVSGDEREWHDTAYNTCRDSILWFHWLKWVVENRSSRVRVVMSSCRRLERFPFIFYSVVV